MTIDVFLSVGQTASAWHRRFVWIIEQVLMTNGFLPRTVCGMAGTPLPAIEREMRRCAGTVCIALERLHAPTAIEHRGASRQQTIEDLSLPSIWIQVEAAFAHSIGHPLFIVVERGLRREGLLSTAHGWPVEELCLYVPEIKGRPFQEAFASWAEQVRANYFAKHGSVAIERATPERRALNTPSWRAKCEK